MIHSNAYQLYISFPYDRMADECITHIQQNKSKANEDQTTESTPEMINAAEATVNTKALLNCSPAAENYSADTLQSQSTAHEPISGTANSPMQAQGERDKQNLAGKQTCSCSVCVCVRALVQCKKAGYALRARQRSKKCGSIRPASDKKMNEAKNLSSERRARLFFVMCKICDICDKQSILASLSRVRRRTVSHCTRRKHSSAERPYGRTNTTARRHILNAFFFHPSLLSIYDLPLIRSFFVVHCFSIWSR